MALWEDLQSPAHPRCTLWLRLQGATATLGIYVDSGSVYETPYTTGAGSVPQLLQCSPHHRGRREGCSWCSQGAKDGIFWPWMLHLDSCWASNGRPR